MWHHISSDNPANWKEDINNTFIVVFNYIGYLINQRGKKHIGSGQTTQRRDIQHSIP